MQAITLASLTLLALGAGTLLTQEKKQERFTHPLPKDPAKAMENWMTTCKPSLAHARLKELLGSYDWTRRIFMEPGKPPMEEKGTAEFTWLTEGKWLQQKWTGPMFGMPSGGLTILGYDNFKERFVSCSVDALQTTMQTAFGHFDQSGDDLILWGTIDEPGTPEQDKQCKYVYRGFGKDKFTFEVHDMMIGEQNTKVVEI